MSMPRLTCQCGARYRFDDAVVGKKAKCKKCGSIFVIESEDEGIIPFADEPDFFSEVAQAARRSADAPSGGDAAARAVGGGAVRIAASSEGASTTGPTCPCCRRQLAPSAIICVGCDIHLKSGRGIVTAQETNLDEVYVAAENIIGLISWVFWTGIYPVASEAFGGRKPYAIRAIAVLTIVASLWFLAFEWTESPRMMAMKNLMLWTGDREPDSTDIFIGYELTQWGDAEAFHRKLEAILEEQPDLDESAAILAAHRAMEPSLRYTGQYSAWQLLTHAFLHGGLVHLAGNLLFLLVFGSRINAIIGNVMTLVLYPLLAIGAGLVHLIAESDGPPTPMLGASGAVMGLAGMYLVLFPLHKMHMAAWVRWGLFAGFHLSLKMWSVRGIWVVLFYLAFDVFYTSLGVEDGVAHFAHLGGFGVGVCVGLLLLFTRLVNARGCDVVSTVLGRFAWSLVGRPNRGVGWLERIP